MRNIILILVDDAGTLILNPKIVAAKNRRGWMDFAEIKVKLLTAQLNGFGKKRIVLCEKKNDITRRIQMDCQVDFEMEKACKWQAQSLIRMAGFQFYK